MTDPVILTTEQAAALLHCAPRAIQRKAKAGILPGRKVGKGYVFVQDHLIEWISRRYDTQPQPPNETPAWPSTNATAPRTGKSASLIPADAEYNAALGLTTNAPRKSSTTGSRQTSGGKVVSLKNRSGTGKTRSNNG